MARTGIAAAHLAVMLVHMLAYMEQITASLSKTGECMTILTGAVRHIKRGDKCVVEVGFLPYSQIGELHSGETTWFWEQSFCRRHPPNAGGNRSPVRPTDGKLLFECQNCFPSDKEIQIRYIIQQEDARFRLGTPDGTRRLSALSV